MIKPINDYVLIKLDEKETESKGGILYTENKKKQPQSGTIVAIGTRVKETFTIGNRIQFELGEFRKVKDDDGTEYAVVEEKMVIGVFEE